jgi:hypothetical protein
MKQFGAKSNDKQVKYNTPIKFKSTQDSSHAPQAKAKVVPVKSNKKPKPHASQDNFYVDYVLTWDHKGKVQDQTNNEWIIALKPPSQSLYPFYLALA